MDIYTVISSVRERIKSGESRKMVLAYLDGVLASLQTGNSPTNISATTPAQLSQPGMKQMPSLDNPFGYTSSGPHTGIQLNYDVVKCDGDDRVIQ